MILGLEIGSWEDWVSGIGSLSAIIFVYVQIRQQGRQHEEDNGFLCRVNFEIFQTESGKYIKIFAANLGMRPRSFRFEGICRVEDIDKIFVKGDTKHYEQESLSESLDKMSPEYIIYTGSEEFDFETVEAGGISTKIPMPVNVIKGLFPDDKQTVCAIYTDVAGTIYKKTFRA